MSQITLWDHLLAVFVFVVYPYIARRGFPDVVRRVRETGEPAKIAAYRSTIGSWVAFAGALAALWITLGRSWGALGIGPVSPLRFAAGAGLAALLLLGFVAQWRALERSENGIRDLFDGVGDLAAFMPETEREARWFRAVSVNAGITEELLYRGFLMWYLQPALGTGLAAAVTVVAFTVGHAYQGLRQLPGIAFAAAALIGLYLVSGSLLVPILFHAAGDIVQGNALARSARRREPGPSEPRTLAVS